MSVVEIGEWVLSGGVLAAVGWQFGRFVIDEERRARLHVGALRRAPRARRAATEAALDDPMFEPERIQAAVTEILDLAASVWRREAVRRSERRKDWPLIRGWAAQREELLGSGLSVSGRVRVDLMNVVNRGRKAGDWVVVRVRFHIRRGPAAPFGQRTVVVDERWTLARRREQWSLASVAGDPIAEKLTSAPLIASPAQDVERLREESLEELSEPPVATDVSPGELIDATAKPDLRLRDLAVADDRFSPALIGAAITHIAAAWEEASDGSNQALAEVATPVGMTNLMTGPEPDSRRQVRDAVLKHWEVLDIQTDDVPRVVVAVRVRAAVYLTHGSHGSGSDRHAHDQDLVWTLELGTDRHNHPHWRLCASADRVPT